MIEEFHVMTFNNTYWTGWPSAEDPYVAPYTPWESFNLVIHNLQPAHSPGRAVRQPARASTLEERRRVGQSARPPEPPDANVPSRGNRLRPRQGTARNAGISERAHRPRKPRLPIFMSMSLIRYILQRLSQLGS